MSFHALQNGLPTAGRWHTPPSVSLSWLRQGGAKTGSAAAPNLPYF
ncbi:hypothetical protein HMPREF9946_00992 [Acetobacteraceae bacterium AT-5844]|nr:hypothetical protein HMPREF9946_00992 [Acetobacteraceae bacterium AT-5844]